MNKTALSGIVVGLLQGWLNKKERKREKNQWLYKEFSSNSLNTVRVIQKRVIRACICILAV